MYIYTVFTFVHRIAEVLLVTVVTTVVMYSSGMTVASFSVPINKLGSTLTIVTVRCKLNLPLHCLGPSLEDRRPQSSVHGTSIACAYTVRCT